MTLPELKKLVRRNQRELRRVLANREALYSERAAAVLACYRAGNAQRDIARAMGVSITTVSKLCHRGDGPVLNLTQQFFAACGREPLRKTPRYAEVMDLLVAEAPDLAAFVMAESLSMDGAINQLLKRYAKARGAK